jgi:putative oxidoreductase
MQALASVAPLLGRILFAALFIPAGLSKLTGFEGTVGYIASKGLPLPQAGAAAAIVVEVLVAAALLVGWRTRWAALILAVFTAAAAVIFHNYWAVPAEQQMAQSINFWKNIAIVGGLLFVIAHGPGPVSVDAKGGRSGF